MRRNMDPFNEHHDVELWNVLGEVRNTMGALIIKVYGICIIVLLTNIHHSCHLQTISMDNNDNKDQVLLVFYWFGSARQKIPPLSRRQWTISSGARGAPWVNKYGNLLIRKILVLTSAYVRPYRLWGRVRGVPRQPDRGRWLAIFSCRTLDFQYDNCNTVLEWRLVTVHHEKETDCFNLDGAYTRYWRA